MQRLRRVDDIDFSTVTGFLNAKRRAVARATHRLASLRYQTNTARALLTRLQQDVAEAESCLENNQAAQLREANGQLLTATLRAREDAEAVRRALNEVSRLTALDSLTELPNRVMLLEQFDFARSNSMRDGFQLALLFVDLNDFKHINDTLGHSVGDRVLQHAARCLVSAVRATDTTSRYGGDEFLILLTNVSRAEAAVTAERVIAALATPCRVGEHVLCLTASVGISIYPDDGDDADTLIDRADASMYRAKRHGLRSFAFHEQAPIGEVSLELPPLASLKLHSSRYESMPADQDRQSGQLREANEQLVLAALAAQTLQAAAERAQQRQTELLALIAHELRSPLSPIRTAANLLGHAHSDKALLAKAQAIIERQVAHMSRLISDLLDISRVNTGKLRIECQRIDMATIIAAVVDACGPAIALRGQRLDVRLPARALEVHGDPVRLVQVFSNLLDNASKYTPEGGEISLVGVATDGVIVTTVSDNGIGITAAALSNVFEPFVQDAHAIGFNGVGLGIGLTVVRELVEAHGGHVVAHSAGSGLGSQFVVTLPLSHPLLSDENELPE